MAEAPSRKSILIGIRLPISPPVVSKFLYRCLFLLGILLLNSESAHAANEADVNRLKRTGSCPACALSGADFSGMELSGADLNSAKLSDADLSNTQLIDADLEGAVLATANLKGADLTQANLSRAILRGANLEEAVLFDADLRSADLSSAYLKSADLGEADLRKAILSHTVLTDAILSGADFRETSVRDVIGLHSVTWFSAPVGLAELRQNFKDGGRRTEEREITYAIKHNERRNAGTFEAIFNYLLFEITSSPRRKC